MPAELTAKDIKGFGIVGLACNLIAFPLTTISTGVGAYLTNTQPSTNHGWWFGLIVGAFLFLIGAAFTLASLIQMKE